MHKDAMPIATRPYVSGLRFTQGVMHNTLVRPEVKNRSIDVSRKDSSITFRGTSSHRTINRHGKGRTYSSTYDIQLEYASFGSIRSRDLSLYGA